MKDIGTSILNGLTHPNLPLFLLEVSAVAALIGALWLYLRYSVSLTRINTALKAVARGDLSARIVSPSHGKLGRVMTDINAMLDRMQMLIKNLNNSSAEIAHTLKHPLIRLRQQLQEASHGVATDDPPVLLSSAIDQIDSLLALVDSILDVKQIEAGHLKSRFVEVDLGELVRKLVDLYEPVIEDAGHHLRVELDARSAMIAGMPELLFQMLSNLVENAIRYCPEGTHITIALERTTAQYMVIIADDGPGLSAQDREYVFVPFFRPESVSGLTGHGVGIPLSAAVAKLHDTRISLSDNAPGLRASISFATCEA